MKRTALTTKTAHHLSLLVDDWSANVVSSIVHYSPYFMLMLTITQHHYCKPSAKSPEDRRALLNAVVTSNGKFFLGTDSARMFLPPSALSYPTQADDS